MADDNRWPASKYLDEGDDVVAQFIGRVAASGLVAQTMTPLIDRDSAEAAGKSVDHRVPNGTGCRDAVQEDRNWPRARFSNIES
jgi:hypothetical protein